MAAQTVTQPQNGAVKVDKYLTFVLGDEQYGLAILNVREIISMMEVTRVPRTPPFLKGIINLRGRVIPVMDLRMKFGMPSIERTPETCIVVASLNDVEMGVIVDKVVDVLDIAAASIDKTPSFGGNVDTSFIQGIGKVEKRVIILLDLINVLTKSDLLAVSGLGQAKVAESDTRTVS